MSTFLLPFLPSEKALGRAVHRNVKELITGIDAYIKQVNAAPKPYRWTNSADEILASYQAILPLIGRSATPEMASIPDRPVGRSTSP